MKKNFAPTSLTLRALARLLGYPGPELLAHLDELRQALHGEAALSARCLAKLEALIASLEARPALDVEADYVQLFDSGRRTSLYLFEHVHGDSRDRGPALVDLAQTFEKAGLYLAIGEMPDHLPVVLEYASTQPARAARSLLQEMAHILNAIFAALDQRRSRYAAVLGALLELAGESARPMRVPDEPSIDSSWAEPLAFDGCATGGQSRPGQPQPIHVVRPSPGRTADTGAHP
jgi:nitrate reductase delta subunit